MRSKEIRRGGLQILSLTRNGRMLIKERWRQIQLVGLIETIGQLHEGDRMKAILRELRFGIDLRNRHFEQASNHLREHLAQRVH